MCIYCGLQDAETRDHIPPACFFPSPKPSNLITVPCRTKCNVNYGKDDEYVRNVIANLDTTWCEPDTILVTLFCDKASIAFDQNEYLQLLAAPLIYYWNYEVYHLIYVNDSIQLPAILTPSNPIISIPPSGGTFSFDVEVSNAAALPVTFDAWINAVLPNGSIYGPIIQRGISSLQPGSAILRTDLFQSVPGGAPPGEYYYRLQVGSYLDSIVVSVDSFAFTKEGVDVGASEDWLLGGWDGAAGREGNSEKLPSDFLIVNNYPNPFNATTIIRFQLPVAGFVTMDIFDVNGCNVGAVREPPLRGRWYPAGVHQITFDGSNLPSGIYFYRMTTGDFTVSGKMVLMK